MDVNSTFLAQFATGWPADVWHVTVPYYAYFLVFPLIVGLATVWVTISINHGVRLHRIKMIAGFSRTFAPPKAQKEIIDAGSNKSSRKISDLRESPSLEFVVTKYITDLDEELNNEQFYDLKNIGRSSEEKDRASLTYLNSIKCFKLPVNRRTFIYSLPFIAIVAFGTFCVLLAVESTKPLWLVNRIAAVEGGCISYVIPIAVVFLSAYISTLTMLVRAVCLFDLSAITFFRVFMHILSSLVTGLIVWLIVQSMTSSDSCHQPAMFLVYVILFGIGFVPDAGTRFLLSSIVGMADKNKAEGGISAAIGGFVSGFSNFLKLTDSRFASTTPSVPLDVIDGIDFFTRFRLEEAGIYEVQNLAVTNPILLHIETPFGIYQTIDWVGQAQLCTVVGPERFLILRQFNIRTVFDLERAILSVKATSQLRRIIGGILMMRTNTLGAIEKLSGSTMPNMADPGSANIDVDQYTTWAVKTALDNATFQVRLPRKPNSNEPCDYRVYPEAVPAKLKLDSSFVVQLGDEQQTYDIYDTQDPDGTIKHIVRLIMDDLHVMRLRQIWESIGRILGNDAATLDDSEDVYLGH